MLGRMKIGEDQNIAPRMAFQPERDTCLATNMRSGLASGTVTSVGDPKKNIYSEQDAWCEELARPVGGRMQNLCLCPRKTWEAPSMCGARDGQEGGND